MTRHPFRLERGGARALSLLFRAWCWYGPLRSHARRQALSRILEDV